MLRSRRSVDGEKYGEGISPPNPTRGSGGVVISPSGVQGGALAENGFGAF